MQIQFNIPDSQPGRRLTANQSSKNIKIGFIAITSFVLLMLYVSLAPLLAIPAIFTSTFKLVENLDPAAQLASGGVQSIVIGMLEQQLPDEMWHLAAPITSAPTLAALAAARIGASFRATKVAASITACLDGLMNSKGTHTKIFSSKGKV